MLQIPYKGQYGVFDNLHDYERADKFTSSLTHNIRSNHGTAFPAFIEHLLIDTDDHVRVYAQIEKAISGEHTNAQIKRGARCFAVSAYAGELATKYGITGWSEGDAINAAKVLFDCWVVGWRGTSDVSRNETSLEDKKVLEQVVHFIEAHGDSRFSRRIPYLKSGLDDTRIINRAGYYERYDPDAGDDNDDNASIEDSFVEEDDSQVSRLYLFNNVGFKEAIKGFDKNMAIDILIQHGVLLVGRNVKTDGYKVMRRIHGKRERFYAVLPGILD